MKPVTHNIIIATALLFASVGGESLAAQATTETAGEGQPSLAVPIKIVGARLVQVPYSFMHKTVKDEKDRSIEVLDLSVAVSSHSLETFPPSLQPLLYIGGKAYPAQRVEYSNWDLGKERPIDKKAPVGEIQTIHFFIEEWRKLEQGQPMMLSILSPQEIRKLTGGYYTVEQFNRIAPELNNKFPRFIPQEFIKMGRVKDK